MLQIFKNPYVGIIGSFASIISLLLAIYFYLAAHENRELTYYVHPAKASLVGANQNNNFEVLYNKLLVESEVTAATVAFWNAGERAIRKSDILKPLEIIIKDNKPIFEAKIVKKSRDVVKINLNDKSKSKGILVVGWNVLEKNDGASVQIIYAGSPDDTIEAQSVIVGQSVINEIRYPGSIKSPEEQYSDFNKSNRKQGYIFLVLGIGTIILYFSMSIYFSIKLGRLKTPLFA